MVFYPLLSFLLIAFTNPVQTLEGKAFSSSDFDQKVNQVMKDFRVPGVAIGLVEKDQVIFAQGYGFADKRKTVPVNTRTAFPIGSISKSFAASLIARFVENGTLEWDQPLHQVLTDFRLQDSAATDRATVSDALGHRLGLARHDVMWMSGFYGRQDIYQRLKDLEPALPFREGFYYSNLNYLIAGMVAERIYGKSWEALVQEHLLQPLAMKQTWASISAAAKHTDVAEPFTIENDQLTPVGKLPLEIDSIAPAGAMVSCIDDMLIWLKLHMNHAESSDVISTPGRQRLQTPIALIPDRPSDDRRGSVGVGMGWFLEWYQGHYLVNHSGVVEGYSAWIGFFPFQSKGVVVLSNRYGNATPEILGRYALDRMLAKEPVDWHGAYLEIETAQRAQARGEGSEPANGSRPATSIEHAGTYLNTAYGPLNVVQNGEHLELHAGPLGFKLRLRFSDYYDAVPIGEHGAVIPPVHFQISEEKKVIALSISFDPSVAPIRFEKQGQP